MNEQINDILNSLSSKKIDTKKALEEIENIDYTPAKINENIKYAKKIKIYINAIDTENNNKNIKINLPAISIKFIGRLSSFFIKIAIKHSGNNEKIKNINFENINNIFYALTMMPPFEIINVDTKDAKIHIYTC